MLQWLDDWKLVMTLVFLYKNHGKHCTKISSNQETKVWNNNQASSAAWRTTKVSNCQNQNLNTNKILSVLQLSSILLFFKKKVCCQDQNQNTPKNISFCSLIDQLTLPVFSSLFLTALLFWEMAKKREFYKNKTFDRTFGFQFQTENNLCRNNFLVSIFFYKVEDKISCFTILNSY